MGYVSNPHGVADAAYIEGGTYEVEVAGERLPACVSLQPFYDPKSLRVKA
jgi:4-methylaminobutanoate oxidase (formaldehyde-forming)